MKWDIYCLCTLFIFFNAVRVEKYRIPIYENNRENEASSSSKTLVFNSDINTAIDGVTYKNASILKTNSGDATPANWVKEDSSNTINNRSSNEFSFMERNDAVVQPKVFKEDPNAVTQNGNQIPGIENNKDVLTRYLSEWIADIVKEVYVRRSNNWDDVFEKFKRGTNKIINDIIQENNQPVEKSLQMQGKEKENINIFEPMQSNNESNEIEKNEIPSPMLMQDKQIKNTFKIKEKKREELVKAFNSYLNVDADESSLVSDILKEFK